jgi:hypothetical protein
MAGHLLAAGSVADRCVELHRLRSAAGEASGATDNPTSGMRRRIERVSDDDALGRLHFDCMTLGVMPEELDAMSESGGVASSMSANTSS